MKVLIFNGALERRPQSTAGSIASYLASYVKNLGHEVEIFHVTDSGIPLFDFSLKEVPRSVEIMNSIFREADLHIWLTPLYHGSMTGVMKNCLDWLEISAKMPYPYLTGKRVGFVCWADGVQAMQGINALDVVAKALRAWTLPYSVPVQKHELLDKEHQIKHQYKERFERLVQILVTGPMIIPGHASASA